MNITTKHDRLVYSVKMLASYAQSCLLDEKRGINVMNKDLTQVANQLSWNVEGWMLASHRLQWAVWAMKELEKVALDAIEMGYCDGLAKGWAVTDEEWFDDQAEKIIRLIATEAMATIFRGVESSSNAMTILESRAKLESAKSAMESLCGLGSWHMTSWEATHDLMDGVDRRRAAEEAESLKVPSKMLVEKREPAGGGEYIAKIVNKVGEQLWFIELGTARKNEAKVVAKHEANKISADRNRSIIIEGI